MKSSMWLEMLAGVLGGLGVFLYGMRIMSRGLESVGGERMKRWLQHFTGHPLSAVFTGVVVTCLIQSSSATTVILVSLVHASFLSLTQAIGVILGANIGTTLTGWLVASLGFKVKIAKFALPCVALGVLLIFITKGGRKRALWGEILVGFGLLFLGLMFMKDAVSVLKKAPEIKQLLSSFSATSGFFSLSITVLVGALVTILIQSSSATMALTITLAYGGIITFPTAAALILGENIGTTVTANLAALGTDVAAKRTARAHLVFNLSGVVWAILLFSPFLWAIDQIVPGDPMARMAIQNAGKSEFVFPHVASHMAAFHTVFNIINTLLFLPLIGILATLVTRIVPGDSTPSDKRHILYLDARIVATPALAMTAVQKELNRMLDVATSMFSDVMKLFDNPKTDEKTLVKEIKQSEDVVDALEREITDYLAEVSLHETSVETSKEITRSIHIAHNIEKIADHSESILRLVRRKYNKELEFSSETKGHIHNIAGKVEEFLSLLTENLPLQDRNIMNEAEALEQSIDQLRGELRAARVDQMIESDGDVKSHLIFIDMLSNFEKIGDYAYNIAQYISSVRK